MSTYDRAWLRAQVRDNLHDQQMPDSRIDYFIDMGALKIGQKLKSSANQVTTDWQINDSLGDLPADLVEIRTLRYARDGGLYALYSQSSHAIENFSSRSGGQPLYYAMRGGKIAVRPFVAGVYELTYWANTALTSDAQSTNQALTDYPYLFVNAALDVGYQYKQDEEQRLAMQSQWLGEVREINATAARRDAGDVPAQRAM